MRRFVALLLLVLLPLQAVWAAAAPYCHHEGGTASHHIGHHQPEHHHADASSADAGDSGHGDTTGTAAEHTDCHVCHGGTVLTHEVRLVQAMPTTVQHVPAVPRGLPAPPTERPERPKWPALA